MYTFDWFFGRHQLSQVLVEHPPGIHGDRGRRQGGVGRERENFTGGVWLLEQL